MAKKNNRNTKQRIVSAAWKLFYEQGFDNTTVEDIVFESETSRGSFYHYFESKEALLGGLAMLFDEKYEELEDQLPEEMDTVSRLLFLNHELFTMIDNRVPMELLSRLYASQLLTKGEKDLLDRNRVYFRLLIRLVRAGQEKGELRTDLTINEIVSGYAMFERALIYDWCLNNGKYALARYADQMMPLFLSGYRK